MDPANTTIVTTDYEHGALEARENFNSALSVADDIVTKNYLAHLTNMEVIPPEEKLFIRNAKESVRLIKINEMVYEQDEYATLKFTSVFGALTTVENTVFLLVKSDGAKTDFYMGVRCDDEKREAMQQLITLTNSLQGQFPGIKMNDATEMTNTKIIELMDSVKDGTISSVSCVANIRDENTRENKEFLQGLEKFALSMRGKPYTAIILAGSLPQNEIANIRRQYESIYSELVPISQQQITYGTNSSWNSSESNTTSITVGVTETVGKTTTKGTSFTHNEAKGESVSKDNTASRVLKGLGTAAAVVGGAALVVATGGIAAPAVIAAAAPAVAAGAGIAGGALGLAGSMVKKTITTSTTTSTGFSVNESESEAYNRADMKQQGVALAETRGWTIGKTESNMVTMQNKSVLTLMERIDKQLERIREFESYGMWECSTYFISEEPNISEIAASTYKAIMSGEHTGVEISAVNSWPKRVNENDNRLAIFNYITNFMQPLFKYKKENILESLEVSAGTFVSGKELALHMGLPRHSVPGFPVIEHAEFGKEIVCYKKEYLADIPLGKIYDMGRIIETDEIKLDSKSLTMHTFITGSTGSGKSNTIYHLLGQFIEKKIPFLVIEPAKGEYKDVFGNKDNVTVLGTNPDKTRLLKLNPFSFPGDVHILEHLDRLVELFNVCWPMYAAMPAILKDAMERAYEEAGWDLQSSKCAYDNLYPTFVDLLEQIEIVIKETEYSSDSKGDYTGALCTRIRSLTNGLNRMIFTNDAIPDDELFDENVIVDLSRVGSSETKSLIMGLLVLKLQEYRASEKKGSDKKLEHVTVLEEAHHLLRRTSTEQSQESSNLQGKSVEMLSNAIAEMRTYGEGFIIADQAPGLLDMSVIRNTNTKIILRLPEQSDRELVGRAAGLNDEQIMELSKLEQGVAAVYQNDWVEAVLVKIDHYDTSKTKSYEFDGEQDNELTAEDKLSVLNLLIYNRVENLKVNIEQVKDTLPRLNIPVSSKIFIDDLLRKYENDKSKITAYNTHIAKAVTDILACREIAKREILAAHTDFQSTHKRLSKLVKKILGDISEDISKEISIRLMYDFFETGKKAEKHEEILNEWNKCKG